MANFKRRRPKNHRAGCLMCKPWKVNGVRTEGREGESIADHRRRQDAAAAIEELQDWLAMTPTARALELVNPHHPPEQIYLELLEAQEPQAALIFADWLSDRGDPRGDLIRHGQAR